MSVWIISVTNSAANEPLITSFTGTAEDVEEHMLRLISRDREVGREHWDCGTETIGDLICFPNEDPKQIDGYGMYSEYHIDYVAVRADSIGIIPVTEETFRHLNHAFWDVIDLLADNLPEAYDADPELNEYCEDCQRRYADAIKEFKSASELFRKHFEKGERA